MPHRAGQCSGPRPCYLDVGFPPLGPQDRTCPFSGLTSDLLTMSVTPKPILDFVKGLSGRAPGFFPIPGCVEMQPGYSASYTGGQDRLHLGEHGPPRGSAPAHGSRCSHLGEHGSPRGSAPAHGSRCSHLGEHGSPRGSAPAHGSTAPPEVRLPPPGARPKRQGGDEFVGCCTGRAC